MSSVVVARPHHPVDVEQRVLASSFIDRERVADVGADVDVVDVEERQTM